MASRLRTVLNHLSHSPISTMSDVKGTSKACCTIPPVVSQDYTLKGVMKPFAGYSDVYVTGPEKSDNALICVYDIFGFWDQTKQGADILASALSSTAFMPDLFADKGPYPMADFPPNTPERKQNIGSYFLPGYTQETAKKIVAFANHLKGEGYKKVGVYGFCWGGKTVTMAGIHDSAAFAGLSIIHPASVTPEEVDKVSVPFAYYPTRDESKDDYDKIAKILEDKAWASKNDHKYYGDTFHGFAAARANLKDEANKKEYEDLYARLANFFQNAFA